MKPEEIKLSDWARIFFWRNATLILYRGDDTNTDSFFLLLIISMRFLGRKMAAQASRIEMIALFTLAAAIGVPLQAPDRGLLPAVLIAVLIVVIGRGVASLVFRNQKLEANVVGKLDILVDNGILQMDRLLKTRLTVQRVFAQLRSENIRHLGEVRRLYMEANGSFSLVKMEQPSFGLTILPDSDPLFLQSQKQSDELVCKRCGQPKKMNNNEPVCYNCSTDNWVLAAV